MYSIVRGLLFLFPAELAHNVAMRSFSFLCNTPFFNYIIRQVFLFEDNSLCIKLLGLSFKNPIGLAAGFDKNGEYIKALEVLGFGFVEIGTVTPLPQKGNSKPRLFRLKKDRAIINRMGFNNAGVDAMVSRLKKIGSTSMVIGGNIGKNKDKPLATAHEDYLECFIKLYDYVDYFVVNVSSPNTPGLRSLQAKEPLEKILNCLIEFREKKIKKKPILLKISPDLSSDQLSDVINIVNEINIEGVVATNTTTTRNHLKMSKNQILAIGAGGLSGPPLKEMSSTVINEIRTLMPSDKIIIGVGGIDNLSSAREKLESGAHLIQMYTGFVYKGPLLVRTLKHGLVKNLKF